MKTPLIDTIHLLHEAATGTLATHAAQMPGYPYATALPFVPDDAHRPVWLVSGLAEHTKNLQQDARASFLVTSTGAHTVANEFRVTIVGDAQATEASKELVARYLRYEPNAQQYLDLGDFAFFTLMPKRVRYIAGFGQMGWIDENEWQQAENLSLVEEAAIYHELMEFQSPGMRLLGVDCYGLDIEREGKRERQRFPQALNAPEKVRDSARRLLAAIGSASMRLF